MELSYKQKIKLEIKKELARRSFTDYCKLVNGEGWFLGKHIKLVCESIEKLVSRQIEQNILIISMPP